jgi:hypothetical protein
VGRMAVLFKIFVLPRLKFGYNTPLLDNLGKYSVLQFSVCGISLNYSCILPLSAGLLLPWYC